MIGISASGKSVTDRSWRVSEAKEGGMEMRPDSDNALIVVDLVEMVEDCGMKSLAIVTGAAMDLNKRMISLEKHKWKDIVRIEV